MPYCYFDLLYKKVFPKSNFIPLRAKRLGELIEIRHKKISPTRLYFTHQHTYYGTMPQAGIDPPAQSHASNEASAPPQATTARWVTWSNVHGFMVFIQ